MTSAPAPAPSSEQKTNRTSQRQDNNTYRHSRVRYPSHKNGIGNRPPRSQHNGAMRPGQATRRIQRALVDQWQHDREQNV